MQIKIEIKINQNSYKIKLDDELTIREIIDVMKLKDVDYSQLDIYIQTKRIHMLADHQLKDFGIVNNDVIEITT
ncbi:hypothetical protein RZE82_06410 [Mollicutes bacterium LVI A0039]|nr:hypothetical protein RZE82_06410 [Mollicutes bacterium LVI A0039]